MKKIFTFLLIFSLLSTLIFCQKEEYEEYEEEENSGLDNLTEEDIKKLQDLFSKIIPFFPKILNDYKDPKTDGEKFIYDVLDKVSSILELLNPMLHSDPQTFLEALIQISDKFNKLEDYIEGLIEDVNIDEVIDAYTSLLKNDNIIQMYDLLKDDIIYFIQKDMGPEGALYSEIISDIYPNLINLIKSDEAIEFIKKFALISAYNDFSPDHFSKEYDVKALGEEAKKIYSEKIKNNEDFKKIVSKITEKVPFIDQSLIDSYFNSMIDDLVEGDDDY